MQDTLSIRFWSALHNKGIVFIAHTLHQTNTEAPTVLLERTVVFVGFLRASLLVVLEAGISCCSP